MENNVQRQDYILFHAYNWLAGMNFLVLWMDRVLMKVLEWVSDLELVMLPVLMKGLELMVVPVLMKGLEWVSDLELVVIPC